MPGRREAVGLRELVGKARGRVKQPPRGALRLVLELDLGVFEALAKLCVHELSGGGERGSENGSWR